jgi:putative serine protease PepD
MVAMPPSRTLAVGAAVLALGAGGGAAATALVGGSPASTTTVVTQSSSPAFASSKSSDALTVGQIYQRSKQSVVDLKTGSGEGTGYVINHDGDIVTNQHVVDGATTLTVTFADGRKATGKVVGTDASTDVAVVRVDVPQSELKPLTFADSSKVTVGDPVVAIGSPYGLAGSATTGIVSALGRSITSPSNYTITGAIQTDAAINPGNSGGPLLDADGDVIGMNAQIESRSNGNTGVGFAIAANTVQRVAQQLAGGHAVQHAYLGVELGDAKGDTEGAQIGAVRPGAPAGDAGVKAGDVVVAIDGTPVAGADAAVAAIDARKPGDKIKLSIVRDGQKRSITATLGTRPN